MKKKSLLKSFCLICSMTMLLSCPVTLIPAHAAEAAIPTSTSEDDTTIQPRAAIIEWVFKEVDRRLDSLRIKMNLLYTHYRFK